MKNNLFKLLASVKAVVRVNSYSYASRRYFSCKNINTYKMIESKHYSKGSVIPPLNKGVLRVYNMRFCPYAQRVLLVLDAKKIPYEVVNIDLTEKPEWLFEKSPLGKVPALEFDGEILYESLIVSDYLDEKYPGTPLYPKDPLQKAKDRVLIYAFNKVISYMLGMLLNPSKMDQENLNLTFDALDLFEKELVKRNQPYFGGSSPGMVDLMIWPWCERADLFRIIGGEDFKLPEKRFMRLMEWAKSMKENDCVKVSYLKPEIHAKYLLGKLNGYPDYDMLVPTSNL